MHTEKRGYIYIAISGELNSEKFKEFNSKLVDLCLKSAIKKIIFDSSQLSVVNQDSIEWLKKQVIPSLAFYPLEKIALLCPDNPILKLIIKKLLNNEDHSRAKIFDTIEGAERWLSPKPEVEVMN